MRPMNSTAPTTAPSPAPSPTPSPATSPRLHIARGHILFTPGQECGGFVIVHSGTICVSLTAANGREIILYRVRSGEICLQTFGCLVEDRCYSAQGVAETDLEIEIVPTGQFQIRLAGDVPFRTDVLRAVASRFADLERLVEDVALTGLEARLARALLRLAGEGEIVDATHEALALETGSGRAAITRQLNQLAHAALIRLSRGQIRILDRPMLESLCVEE